MAAGTSPSVNANDVVAVQETSSVAPLAVAIYSPAIWSARFRQLATYTGLGMMAGTSPSINDNNDVAFQGSNGDL